MTKRIVRCVELDGTSVDREMEFDPADEEHMRKSAAMHAEMALQRPSEAALADPDLMRIWGELNLWWDEIEGSLYVAFDSMLEADGFSTRAIFYSVKVHAGRRDMVEELAQRYFSMREKSETFKELKVAIKHVKARSGIRNSLTHGFWGWNINGSALTFECVRFAADSQFSVPAKMFFKRDLERERDAMKTTAKELVAAVKPLFEAKVRFQIGRSNREFDSERPLRWPPGIP